VNNAERESRNEQALRGNIWRTDQLLNGDSWEDPADDEDWTTNEEWNEGEDEGR